MEYSAEFEYLEKALRARWPTFTALCSEMSSFVPKTLQEFDPERSAMMDQLRQANPNKPESELATFVDGQVGFAARPDIQRMRKFDDRYISEYVSAIVLAHAVCESVINAIIAIGLTHVGTPELFELLERADIKQKWFIGPKSFVPSYTFPKGTAMGETLVYLCKQRNALVHHKVNMRVKGEDVIKGSGFTRSSYEADLRWMKRFFNLPYDLNELALTQLPGLPVMILGAREPISHDFPVVISQ